MLSKPAMTAARAAAAADSSWVRREPISMQGRLPAARDHAGRRGGDGAVMVEHGEDVRLQDAGLGEGGFHDQDGGVGEIRLALRVAPDVAGETEAGQVVQGFLRSPPRCGRRKSSSGLAEAEVRDALQQPAGAGHDPVAAAVRQPPGEGLEHRLAGGRRRSAAPPAAWSVRSGRCTRTCGDGPSQQRYSRNSL